MFSKVTQLKDRTGNILYPKTITTAVYNKDGKTVYDQIEELKTATDVAASRLDAVIASSIIDNESDTTTNAELVDIRVEYDGKVADTAGQSVREQITRLKQTIDENNDVLTHVTSLVDKAYVTLFAQVNPTNGEHYVQGMCSFYDNGIEYVVTTFTDGETASGNEIVLTNMDTGVEVARKSGLSLGHASGVAYSSETGYIYVACAGGNNGLNNIVVLNTSLDVIQTVDMACWGIACVDNKLYCGVADSIIEVYDTSFNKLNSVILKKNPATTSQGIETDGIYIYITNGHTISPDNLNNVVVQCIDVYTVDGEYIKTILVDTDQEMKEISFLNNGNILICVNTAHKAILLKSNIYHKTIGVHRSISSEYNPAVLTYGMNQIIYIDETFTGFFIDGTEAKPLPNFNMFSMIASSNVQGINIYLLSDIANNITISGIGAITIRIYGGGHNVAGTGLVNMSAVAIQDVVFNTQYGTTGMSLLVSFVKYLRLTNITFDISDCGIGIGSTSSFIWTQNITFNSLFSGYAINLMYGSSFRHDSKFIDNCANRYFIDNSDIVFSSITTDAVLYNSNESNAKIANTNILDMSGIDLAKINLCGVFTIPNHSTGNINTPTLATGEYMASVDVTKLKPSLYQLDVTIIDGYAIPIRVMRNYSNGTGTLLSTWKQLI